MSDPNPYRPPADADVRPTDRDRVRVTVLAIVLLDVALSVWQVVWNVPDLLRSPDSSAALIGGILVFWVAWIVAELFAARLVWRGHAAGRWILVASFGLKGIGQVGSVWPVLIRAPYLILAWQSLNHPIQAICYCVATVWLLLSAFQKRGVCDSGTSEHFGGDQSAQESFMEPN